jgi:hypothetical protein
LIEKFTTKVPKLKFSLIKIFLFLLEYRELLKEAINSVEQLISKPIRVKLKPLRISEDAKAKDT